MLSAVRISGSRDAPFPKVSLSWAPPPVIPPVANLDTGEDRAEQIGGGSQVKRRACRFRSRQSASRGHRLPRDLVRPLLAEQVDLAALRDRPRLVTDRDS